MLVLKYIKIKNQSLTRFSAKLKLHKDGPSAPKSLALQEFHSKLVQFLLVVLNTCPQIVLEVLKFNVKLKIVMFHPFGSVLTEQCITTD